MDITQPLIGLGLIMTLHETPWMVDIFVAEDWKAIDFIDREITQSWAYLEPETSGESPTKYYTAK